MCVLVDQRNDFVDDVRSRGRKITCNFNPNLSPLSRPNGQKSEARGAMAAVTPSIAVPCNRSSRVLGSCLAPHALLLSAFAGRYSISGGAIASSSRSLSSLPAKIHLFFLQIPPPSCECKIPPILSSVARVLGFSRILVVVLAGWYHFRGFPELGCVYSIGI